MNLPTITTRYVDSGGEKGGVNLEDTTLIKYEEEDTLDLTRITYCRLYENKVHTTLKHKAELCRTKMLKISTMVERS